MTESIMDELPGIGPARKRALLQALRLARGGARRLPRGARERARASRRRSRATSTPTSTRRDAEPSANARTRRRQPTAAGRPTSRTSWSSPGCPAPASRRAMNVFEDAGYFCVDNLPAEMIRSLAELFLHEGSKVERAAVVCDSRGGEYLAALAGVIDQLDDGGVVHRVAVPQGRRGDAGQPLQGDAPPAPARAARQRGRRHPRASASCSAPVRERADIVHRHQRAERRTRCGARSPTSCSSRAHARPARGDLHVVRPQARPAARRRPRVRRPLPAEPALRGRPAAADRVRPADRRLRRPRRPPARSSTTTCCRCSSTCCRSTWPRARRT